MGANLSDLVEIKRNIQRLFDWFIFGTGKAARFPKALFFPI